MIITEEDLTKPRELRFIKKTFDHPLTESQIKALRISDNRLNESEWDIDKLKEEFYDLEGSEEFDWTGFEPEEITEIWDKENREEDYKAENVEKIGSLLLECPKCHHKYKKGEITNY